MQDWKKYLDEFSPTSDLRDEAASLRVCQLAARAAELGTYGVGAILLDEQGEVLVEGYNEVYVDGFRSDLHAEMVVINRFETTHSGLQDLRRCTLVASLEPCPMCMARLIIAGVGAVLYVRTDPIGGMVRRKSSLPPIFRQITEDRSQSWAAAQCSEELREAAFQIWNLTRVDLDQRLISRGQKPSGDTR